MDDYANLDYDRAERCGFPEVIYGASKTPEQICTIATQLLERHGVVMATRVGADAARIVQGHIPDARWFERSGLLFADRREHPVEGMTLGEVLACPNRARGSVIVACAGTSDIGIAEEAALTARIMGSRVRLLADIGVAGVHRTLAHEDDLREARVIVVVAGMEGALASLVAGLVDVPVIGSGDVRDDREAARMLTETGATAVMVARGSYGNPWIFSQARALLSGHEPEPVSLVRRVDAFECHMRLLAATGAHLKRGRSLATWYLRGMPEAAYWRGRANECSTLEEFLGVTAELRRAMAEADASQGAAHE